VVALALGQSKSLDRSGGELHTSLLGSTWETRGGQSPSIKAARDCWYGVVFGLNQVSFPQLSTAATQYSLIAILLVVGAIDGRIHHAAGEIRRKRDFVAAGADLNRDRGRRRRGEDGDGDGFASGHDFPLCCASTSRFRPLGRNLVIGKAASRCIYRPLP